MNKLTKIGRYGAVFGFALCAVLIAPVILIYGVPLAVGAMSDILQLDGGQMASILSVSAAACRAATPVVA
jgi:hypothetical protein